MRGGLLRALKFVCAWLFITVSECRCLFLGVAVYYVRRVVPIGACLLVGVSGASWFSIDGVCGLLPLRATGFFNAESRFIPRIF